MKDERCAELCDVEHFSFSFLATIHHEIIYSLLLTRYILLLTTHKSGITTEFFGTLQGFTWFILLKRIPFTVQVDVKYLSGDSAVNDATRTINEVQYMFNHTTHVRYCCNSVTNM